MTQLFQSSCPEAIMAHPVMCADMGTHLRQPLALLLDELVLIQVYKIHYRLGGDQGVAVQPVRLLYVPIAKSAG